MKSLCIALIKFYKKFISPGLGHNCIYTPTCSTYTIEAIQEYGALKGCFMGFCRILKCNPMSKGGYDPVPKRNNKSKEELFCKQ